MIAKYSVIIYFIMFVLSFFLMSAAGGCVWYFGIMGIFAVIPIAAGPRRYRICGIIALIFVIAAGMFDYYAGQDKREKLLTRMMLKKIAAKNDPEKFLLEQTEYNEFVRFTHLEDGTQTGIISMHDGSSAKFWFRSHHLDHGLGDTLFLMNDGQEMYMSGYFCCSVEFPEKQFESVDELGRFICKHDGIDP